VVHKRTGVFTRSTLKSGACSSHAICSAKRYRRRTGVALHYAVRVVQQRRHKDVGSILQSTVCPPPLRQAVSTLMSNGVVSHVPALENQSVRHERVDNALFASDVRRPSISHERRTLFRRSIFGFSITGIFMNKPPYLGLQRLRGIGARCGAVRQELVR